MYRSLRRLLLGLPLFMLMGCTALAPYTQLPAEEQGLYRAYSHIMTPRQLRTYLAYPTSAARAAYARQIGAAEALEAMSQDERMAVLSGHPFRGMSREALRLTWGDPYLRLGPVQYERWYYFGDYFSLADIGYHYQTADTIMEVALEDGRVMWWEERVPSRHYRSRLPWRLLRVPPD